MKQLVIYVHGKGGNAEESRHYKSFFTESDVIGFDYKAQSPWEAKREFTSFYDEKAKGYDSVILIANSIGAYFSMVSLYEKKIDKAAFDSKVSLLMKHFVDMAVQGYGWIGAA